MATIWSFETKSPISSDSWISSSLEYSWNWWSCETLFRSPASRVYPENSSHKPYLDDKHKPQPHK